VPDQHFIMVRGWNAFSIVTATSVIGILVRFSMERSKKPALLRTLLQERIT